MNKRTFEKAKELENEIYKVEKCLKNLSYSGNSTKLFILPDEFLKPQDFEMIVNDVKFVQLILASIKMSLEYKLEVLRKEFELL